MGQVSGFDLIQEILQKLSGATTTQRITRFGVGVTTVSRERCQACHASVAVLIVTCPTHSRTTPPETERWTPSR